MFKSGLSGYTVGMFRSFLIHAPKVIRVIAEQTKLAVLINARISSEVIAVNGLDIKLYLSMYNKY